MKKVFYLVTCFWVIFCFASISVAQQTKAKKETSPKQKVKDTPYAGEVSVMGITLGKSLNELNIKECPQKKPDVYVNDFEVETVCYKILGKLINLNTDRQLDIPTSTTIGFERGGIYINKEDFLNQPIMEIVVGTDYKNDKRFMEIVTKKFGKYKSVDMKTGESKYSPTKLIYTWNNTKQGHSIAYEIIVLDYGTVATLILKHRLIRIEEEEIKRKEDATKERKEKRF